MTFSKNISSNILGVILMIFGLTCSTFSDTFIKDLVQIYPVSETTFIRSVIRFFITFLIIVSFKPSLLIPNNIKMHLIRAMFSVATIISFSYAYKFNYMSEVTALSYSSVIFIIIFSTIFLKETPSIKIYFAVITGIIGVIIAVSPSSTRIFSIYSIIPLLGAILAALNRVTTKKLTFSNSPITIALYSSAIIIIFTSFSCHEWIALQNHEHILKFFLMGALSVISQFSIIYAIKSSTSVFLAPCDYFTFVLVILIDHFRWDHNVEVNVLIGALIIISSNLSIIFLEYLKSKTMHK